MVWWEMTDEEIHSALALISNFWLVALMAVIQQPFWTRSHRDVISAKYTSS